MILDQKFAFARSEYQQFINNISFSVQTTIRISLFCVNLSFRCTRSAIRAIRFHLLLAFQSQKISTFSREENERRIVNGSNYPNTSHDITDSDILLESRIEKMNVRDSFVDIWSESMCAENLFCG